jgi:hypothetical protein
VIIFTSSSQPWPWTLILTTSNCHFSSITTAIKFKIWFLRYVWGRERVCGAGSPVRLPLPQRPWQLQVSVLKILKGIVSRDGFIWWVFNQRCILWHGLMIFKLLISLLLWYISVCFVWCGIKILHGKSKIGMCLLLTKVCQKTIIFAFIRCVCPYGYSLAADGRHCSGIQHQHSYCIFTKISWKQKAQYLAISPCLDCKLSQSLRKDI